MEASLLSSRREFFKDLRAAGALGLMVYLGGCEKLKEQIKNRPVRRDISKLAANDPIIQTYKDAVNAMKSLPLSDGRNWTRQAQIHNDHCSHGNWYFLPWHRAYLLYFERICRELTGNQDFALPYWNWTANPSIPTVFWGASNPLFNATRLATPVSVANAANVGPSVINSILNETDFLVFASGKVTGQRDFDTYGRLEATPHNYIHGFVGGDMSTFMSPLDPVFWCHHNMIECLWVEWNLNRKNPNTNDAQWSNFNFVANFFDQNGASVDVTVAITLLFPIFNYRFEPCQPGAGAAQLATQEITQAEARALEDFVKRGAPSRLDFLKRYDLKRAIAVEGGRPASGTIRLERAQIAAAMAAGPRQRLLLTLGDVELPKSADFFVRVFLNKPDASPQTPLDDPHYAGSFAFFFDGHGGHTASTAAPRAGYIVEVTETLRQLNRAGALPNMEEVSIQLVPVPFEDREDKARGQRFTLERLELGVVSVKE